MIDNKLSNLAGCLARPVAAPRIHRWRCTGPSGDAENHNRQIRRHLKRTKINILEQCMRRLDVVFDISGPVSKRSASQT